MFKRKLSALNYPNAEAFESQNQAEFRGLILWLEDQKIRHYKIDDRAGLRQENNEQIFYLPILVSVQ